MILLQEPPAEFYEPPEFKGLLFYDGVDSLGRPVVVVDFDAVAPTTARSAVMQYILQRLEPIVSQVPACPSPDYAVIFFKGLPHSLNIL